MGSLLANCPFCDYSLKGLPVEHICPECGRAFDRRWRVFGNRRRWERLSRGWRVAVVGGSALALAYLGFAILHQPISGRWVLLAMTCICSIRAVQWMFGVPHNFIIVKSDAVASFERRKMKIHWYPLDQVTEAEVDFWDRLVLWAGARVLARIPMHAGRTEAERCTTYINSLIDRDGG